MGRGTICAMKPGYLDQGVGRAVAALDAGVAVIDGPVVTLSLAGGCHAPRTQSKVYRREVRPLDDGPQRTQVMWSDAEVRCRKCEWCLAQRRKLWTVRAMKEVEYAQRTWFGTMTLNQPTRQRYVMTARAKVAATSLSGEADYDAYTDDQRFSAVVRMLYLDLTRWTKRVREQSGADLRCLFVVERHRDGTPHLHSLVHERPGSLPVRGRDLAAQWARLGFTQWRLVKLDDQPGRAARYVCKYLAKDALARVRASVSYGAPGSVARKIAVDPMRLTASAIGVETDPVLPDPPRAGGAIF